MFKKIVAAIVVVILASSLYADAGDRSGARLGIMAGFTSSSSNAKNLDPSSIGRYHFGVTAEIPVAFGFAVQPSVLYQAKGTKLSDANIDNFKLDAKVSYIEIPVQIQWGPDLMAFRPYVFAEPFVGYGLYSKVKGTSPSLTAADLLESYSSKSFSESALSRWEYGLGLGAGIDVWKMQVSVKYYWNFGSLYSESGKMNNVGKHVKDAFKDGRNFNGISFSLAFMF